MAYVNAQDAVMDATQMEYEDACFDMVLDKGTPPTLLGGDGTVLRVALQARWMPCAVRRSASASSTACSTRYVACFDQEGGICALAMGHPTFGDRTSSRMISNTKYASQPPSQEPWIVHTTAWWTLQWQLEERKIELSLEEQVKCLSVLEDDESGIFHVYTCTKLDPAGLQQRKEAYLRELGEHGKDSTTIVEEEEDSEVNAVDFFENPFYKKNA